MWCPEGYVSLAELAEAIFHEADARLWIEPMKEVGLHTFNIDIGPPMDEVEAFANWLMARFLEHYQDHIRVATPSGAVLKIASSLLQVETDDPFDYNDYSAFPDTREGRLRAGSVRPHWINFDGMCIRNDLSSKWELSLKPIANFPLCISTAAIPTTAHALVSETLERAANPNKEIEAFTSGEDYRLTVKRMIEAHDNGETVNKAAQKARFGRGRKNAEWLALRREFVKARPDAGKQGRRPTNKR